MSNAQPEPSMEEILASIRRIISEDGEEEATAPAGAPAPRAAAQPAAAKPTPRPAPRPEPAAKAPAPAKPAAPDQAQSHLETEDVEMIKKNVAEAFEDDDAMVDDTTAEAASSAFRSLSQTVRVSEGPGQTLEDIVTDMLRPMVKDWLDANLAAIVEEKVEEEVQRVARRRR